MIQTVPQEKLREWLCERIVYPYSDNMICIGNRIAGQLKGVVGYDHYNGASIMMHVAGDKGWLTKQFLRVIFDYPFNVCKVNMVIGLTPASNLLAVRFNRHIGLTVRATLEDAGPGGDLLVMAMSRKECKYLVPSLMEKSC